MHLEPLEITRDGTHFDYIALDNGSSLRGYRRGFTPCEGRSEQRSTPND
jgi:hypothetical protein